MKLVAEAHRSQIFFIFFLSYWFELALKGTRPTHLSINFAQTSPRPRAPDTVCPPAPLSIRASPSKMDSPLLISLSVTLCVACESRSPGMCGSDPQAAEITHARVGVFASARRTCLRMYVFACIGIQASGLGATTLMDAQLEHKHQQHFKKNISSKHNNSICKHDSCAQRKQTAIQKLAVQ